METSKRTMPEQDKTFSAQKDSAIDQVSTEVADRAAKAYDQTKQVVSQAYEKTSQVATDTYKQALSYGKQNPGTLTLIAFGAGIGIGVLLSGSFSSRSRSSNLIAPIGEVLTQVALAIFR